MKRFAVLAGVLAVASAMAQSGASSDVPKDHWAFSAVDNLFREGILKGYPDGSFKGSRPVSRFEVAATLNAMFAGQVGNIETKLANTNGRVEQAQNSRTEVEALRAAVFTLRANFDELVRQLSLTTSVPSELKASEDNILLMRRDLERLRQQIGTVKGRTQK